MKTANQSPPAKRRQSVRTAIKTRFLDKAVTPKTSIVEVGVAALLALGLHALLVFGLLEAFVGRPGNQPGPSRTMVLVYLPDERQPPKRTRGLADVKPQLIPPHFDAPAVAPIPVPVETVGSILAASTSDTPPFERLITEAEARNPAFLRDYCNHQILSVDGVAKTGTVVLMIRVEDDGHISESKIEESSGSPNADAAAQGCITEMGLFQAHLSSGHTIASWQRAHWIWTSGG
jgi:TonB family protein